MHVLRLTIRRAMYIVALAGVTFTVVSWSFPRTPPQRKYDPSKHHRLVSVNKSGISWTFDNFDLNKPGERADFETLVKKLQAQHREFTIREY